MPVLVFLILLFLQNSVLFLIELFLIKNMYIFVNNIRPILFFLKEALYGTFSWFFSGLKCFFFLLCQTQNYI